MAFLKMHQCAHKNKESQVNHDCLPTLIHLYIMLYLMLAYLMLLDVLSIAVCLRDVI